MKKTEKDTIEEKKDTEIIELKDEELETITGSGTHLLGCGGTITAIIGLVTPKK
ncbi:MAG: hypothetical protein MJ250_03035 [Alphaproteobacteria bacterium]|nr:hypothetical protein [Alphaproteobacteria bacterium]